MEVLVVCLSLPCADEEQTQEGPKPLVSLGEAHRSKKRRKKNSSGVVLLLVVFLCWPGVSIPSLILDALFYPSVFQQMSSLYNKTPLNIVLRTKKHSNCSHVKPGVGVHDVGKMCECPWSLCLGFLCCQLRVGWSTECSREKLFVSSLGATLYFGAGG